MISHGSKRLRTFGHGGVNPVVIFLLIDNDQIVPILRDHLMRSFHCFLVVLFSEVVDVSIAENTIHGRTFNRDKSDSAPGAAHRVKQSVAGENGLLVLADTVNLRRGSGEHRCETDRRD